MRSFSVHIDHYRVFVECECENNSTIENNDGSKFIFIHSLEIIIFDQSRRAKSVFSCRARGKKRVKLLLLRLYVRSFSVDRLSTFISEYSFPLNGRA
jgi:hypothetical protein